MIESQWKQKTKDPEHYYRFCPTDCVKNKTCFKGQPLPEDKRTCYLSPEEEAENQKKLDLYDPDDFSMDAEEDEETCDYTGDVCYGNKLFCEECDVLIEEPVSVTSQ